MKKSNSDDSPHHVRKIAVASRSFSKNSFLRDALLAQFKGSEVEVKFNESGTSFKGEALIEFLQGYDAAIIALEKITEEIVAPLTHLRVISKYGVGLDNIELEALQKRGIKLAWVGGVNKRSVAELTVCFILGCTHQAFYSNHAIRHHNWHQVIGHNLAEKTVGIIGLGHVGQELVKMLRPFGCHLLGNDIRDRSEFAKSHEVELTSFSELLARSDVVSVHVPLTDQTRLFIGRDEINAMKNGAILINSARGNIVEEGAVYAALESRKLACAAFDVFSVEPLTDEKLINHPYLFCTSHIGGSSEEAIRAMGLAAIEGLSKSKEARAENFQ